MSPDTRSSISSVKTLCFLLEGFEYETIEAENDFAKVIKFELNDAIYNAGDILVIMNEKEDILFHGMIGKVADNYGVASDHRGSLLKA